MALEDYREAVKTGNPKHCMEKGRVITYTGGWGWMLVLSALPLSIGATAIEIGRFWEVFLAVLCFEAITLTAAGFFIVGADLIRR